MAPASISAVLVTRDEERNIGRALASVAWADEVVVLDCGSADRTAEICRGAGARFEERPWRGFVDQKNAAAEAARCDWVLSLDADEEVTPGLRAEIESILEAPGEAVGFRMPRRNHYLGRWIRRCGWYPDCKLRLWRRGRGRWVGGRVHERVEVDGPVGRTRAALNHFSYDSIGDHIRRIDTYSELSARDKLDAGVRASFLRMLLVPPLQFLRLYLLRGGLLDGLPGLVVSAMGAWYAFLKQARLWELQRERERLGG